MSRELGRRDFDFNQRSRAKVQDRGHDKRRRFSNSRPVICAKHDQCEPHSSKLLLVADTFVGGDHRIETGFFLPDVQLGSIEVAQACYGQAVSARETRHAANGSPKLRDACSNTFFTSSRDTSGNHSRNSSIVAPPSIFENRAETGTRVPRNTQAPLTLSAWRSTAGQDVQSSIGNSSPLSQQPNRGASGRSIHPNGSSLEADGLPGTGVTGAGPQRSCIKMQSMPKTLTADEILPLVASLAPHERVRVLRFITLPRRRGRARSTASASLRRCS